MDIFQTFGQQPGTLVPRPQNPWAVRGEQFLAYLWEQAGRSERSKFWELRLKLHTLL
jgi:hypothetical protein